MSEIASSWQMIDKGMNSTSIPRRVISFSRTRETRRRRSMFAVMRLAASWRAEEQTDMSVAGLLISAP